jgi:tripartite-type tricarboxylate transporter receptor subunit TctC
MVASVPNLLCVRKDLPANSVAELIAYAKANPGTLNYASSGNGTTIHLSAELFKSMTGVDMVHVAYRGSAPALNDLVGQKVDLMFDNITSIIGQARAGSVKPLAITLGQRSSLAPEYPPIADTLPGYSTTSWTGVGVRAGTPKEICDKIEAGTRAICQDPLLKERLAGLVAETVGTNAVDTTAYIASERQKWGKLITDIKLKLE